MKKIKQLIEFIKDLKYTGWSFLFAWYDLWIGVYFDKKKNWLYILPFPTIGVIIKFECPREKDEHALNTYMRELTKEQMVELLSKHIAPDGTNVKIYLHDKES